LEPQDKNLYLLLLH